MTDLEFRAGGSLNGCRFSSRACVTAIDLMDVALVLEQEWPVGALIILPLYISSSFPFIFHAFNLIPSYFALKLPFFKPSNFSPNPFFGNVFG